MACYDPFLLPPLPVRLCINRNITVAHFCLSFFPSSLRLPLPPFSPPLSPPSLPTLLPSISSPSLNPHDCLEPVYHVMQDCWNGEHK